MRLLNHKQRLSDVKDEPAVVRLALIVLREMNPWMNYTNEEEGILRGMNAETFGARKAAGEITT